jgi:cytochrome P450
MTEAIAKSIQNDPNKSNVVDMHEWASRVTLDIIGLAGMGQDFNAIQDPNSLLAQTYRTIFSSAQRGRLLHIAALLVPQWLNRIVSPKRHAEYEEALATIKRVTHNLVQSKRAELVNGHKKGLDIISVAIESGGFSNEELVNQMMTFLAAGHETTASAMTWAIYLLCRYPEAQRKVREELLASRSVINNPAMPISSMEMARLPYLNAVLNETLRLFPSIPLSVREAESNQIIQGHFIPKGTTVIICPWAINTSKALWGEDALDFIPERWLGGGKANNGGAVSNYANATFFHGPRSCVGKDFARGEFVCLMAALISRFEIESEDKTPKIHGGFVSASPVGGMEVKLTPVAGSLEAENWL